MSGIASGEEMNIFLLLSAIIIVVSRAKEFESVF